MSDNPYAPPKSLVADTEPALPPMERPKQIMWAIWLAAIGYGVGLVVVLLSWDYYSKLQSIGSFLVSQVISLAILVWLYSRIYVGRNWARIVLLIFSAIGMLTIMNRMVMDLLASAPIIARVQTFVGLGLNLVILWLLFLSPGRLWFSRSQARPAH